MAKVGDVAVCGNSLPGLITRISNCELGLLYVGIQLSPSKFGQPWQTVQPTVIGNLDDLIVEDDKGLCPLCELYCD
jgi:hypothetical protein